jgi:CheY-like chemotaxis protein
MNLSQPILIDDLPTILIVDDNRVVLDMLSEGLKSFGFKVVSANNGLDAWNAIDKEHIDIVLSDLFMPDINGIELARQVRGRTPDTKIAIMTGGSGDEAARLLAEGVVDFIFKKPFELTAVCKCLRGAMQAA